jgi:hypothetical protein
MNGSAIAQVTEQATRRDPSRLRQKPASSLRCAAGRCSKARRADGPQPPFGRAHAGWGEQSDVELPRSGGAQHRRAAGGARSGFVAGDLLFTQARKWVKSALLVEEKKRRRPSVHAEVRLATLPAPGGTTVAAVVASMLSDRRSEWVSPTRARRSCSADGNRNTHFERH